MIDYQLKKTAFLEEFHAMHAQMQKWRDENPGADQARIYHGRMRRLRVLSEYYDAAEKQMEAQANLIQELRDRLANQANQLQDYRARCGEVDRRFDNHIPHRQWLVLMNLVGPCSTPKPLAAFLNAHEGHRAATIERAMRAQPDIFRSENETNP